MKKIIIVLIVSLMSLISCKAQMNKLTDNELFEGIKFNNVSLGSIMETKSDLTQVRNLLGNDIQLNINSSGPFLGKDLWNNNIYLNFEDESETGSDYNLTYLEIKTSAISVTIKGITFKLRDNLNIFGGNIVLNTINRDNSVVFIDSDTGSLALSLKVDKVTNEIIEIIFRTY